MNTATEEFKWGEWNFTEALEWEIDEFAKTINQENIHNEYRILQKNIENSTVVNDNLIEEILPTNEPESNKVKEEDVILLLEEIESLKLINKSKLDHFNSVELDHILSILKKDLSENGFVNICRSLCSWKQEMSSIEVYCDQLIFPKLIEKESSSHAVVSAVKELTEMYQEDICQHVLLPLVISTNENFTFTDAELLHNVFKTLKNTYKDLFLSELIQHRTTWQDSQWPLLQRIVPDIPSSSINHIISLMHNMSEEYKKSKAFANLLVCVCKSLKQGLPQKHVDTLLQIAQKNSTLLKRQAVKAIETYQNQCPG